ncbi:MAG: glycosyltransferase [Actinobacteria bacterium]|nr:glycosyltransferase [Actinomycetota bacterium]MBM3711884.1 glycosyltransferase [Actinomycetota bacterium]
MENIFSFPLISVAIVNLDGKSYLKTCLESLDKLDYPKNKLEIIVADNGSKDGSQEFIRQNYPDVKLIENNKNLGFAYANNQAAKEAFGEYIAFLNNDTRVDKSWLIELLKPIYKDKETVCAGSKVLSMDGKRLDFAGGMINFEAKGFQIDYGLPIEKDIHKQLRFTPFVNGGAMLVDRKVFLDVGGFDEDFFAYYEDVDLGWRLWVLGYRVMFCPSSIVYHVHHGTSNRFAEDKLSFLKERNAIYIAFKNYDDENLSKIFSGILTNIYSRIFVNLKFDYKSYYNLTNVNFDWLKYESVSEPEVKPGSGIATGPEIKPLSESETKNKADSVVQKSAGVIFEKEPLGSLMAVKNFLDELPRLKEKRAFIQSHRKRDDKAIFSYFGGQFLSVSPDAGYQRAQVDVLKSLGIYEAFEKRIKRSILIISDEVVSNEMAGPAVRVWNFAEVLAQQMNVTLTIPNKVILPEQIFKLIQYRDEASLKELINQCDIILCCGMTFSKFKSIRNTDKYIIIDIYDPYNLATLVEYKDETIEKQFDVYKSVHLTINEMLYYGDFYICASERQRDFWVGMLAALNRINPYSFNQDPTMRKLIDVVPFGLPSNKPIHTENVLKGVVPGIEKSDFIVIWGGGIYNWFDPLSLIKAMAEIGKIRSDVKLFFLGVKHPNPRVKKLSLAGETIELAKKLGVAEKNVFFNYGWVDYSRRQNYFLESDAGIITHPEHIETRFAFRTRILDYIWAGLPIITTGGDSLSELVEKEKLGITVGAGDVNGIIEAILKLADDRQFYSKCKLNLEKVAKNYTWEEVCKPLIRFCKDPVANAVRQNLRPDQIHTGIDVLDITAKGGTSAAYAPSAVKSAMSMPASTIGAGKRGAGYLIKRFFHHLFKGGPKKAAVVCSNYLKNR